MSKKEKVFSILLFVIIIGWESGKKVNAMHIMEGYLPKGYCILWGLFCIPFLILGYFSVKKMIESNRRLIIILAMAGAYAFVLSSLKIPSVTGSSSHPTGTGLGAILFGPSAMSILGSIVLVFQALLLAHGGITTLGANIFSMAITGPIIAYLVYYIAYKVRIPKLFCVFIAASIGDLATYVVTSIQLALAYPSEVGGVYSSFIKFVSVYGLTQIPLAIIEGILTVIVITTLDSYAKEELEELKCIR